MVEIRPLAAGDSRDEYLDLRFRAFGPADSARVWTDAEAAIADGRCLGAFDGRRLIGAALYLDMRQWWLGRAVPLAGVAGVKIAPEYRGKGVGRSLVASLTHLMAERGYPLSALYAATSPIYRMLGWERAGTLNTASVPARSLLELARPGTGPAPALRRPVPGDAAEVIAVLGRAHELARDCGPVTLDERTVRQWLTSGRWAGQDRYAYLAADGFLAYAWRDGHDEMIVDKLVAVSPETTRALWSVVASHSSVVATVSAQLAPADPLWWLLREQDASPAERHWWLLRVLDAPAAIAARGFPAIDIEVPLLIADDQVPANAGSWMLTVRSGAGRLEPAGGGTADPVRLGARGLAALYAGVPLATLRGTALAEGTARIDGTIPADGAALTGGTALAEGGTEYDAALDAAFAATAFMLDDF